MFHSSCFPEYLRWAREDAGMDAPKVETREIKRRIESSSPNNDDDGDDPHPKKGSERGLFATDRIYPGERLLWIPSNSLIGADGLKALGQRILNKHNDKVEEEEQQHLFDLDCRRYPQHQEESTVENQMRHWERCLVGYIEEFRQFIESDMVDERFASVVKSLDFQWRDDDGVALYLMACQILNAYRRHFSDDSPAEQQVTEAKSAVNNNEENTEPTLEEAPIVFGEERSATESGGELDNEVVVHVEPETLGQPRMQQQSQTHNNNNTSHYPSFLPHIDMLPSSFPTCPLYYTQEELSRIEGTNCHGFTVRMLQQMQADWNKLTMVLQAFVMSEHRVMKCPSCSHQDEDEQEDQNNNNNNNNAHDICWCHILNPQKGYLSYYSYKWALCNIYSRSTDFDLEDTDTKPSDTTDSSSSSTHRHGRRRRRVIAPVFDMINHDFHSTVHHALDQDGNLSVFNGNDCTIEPGEEILLNYGNFPNEKLLLVYGFVVANRHNDNDAVQIFAPLSQEDPLYARKVRLLQTKGGIDNVNAPHLLKLPVKHTTNVSDDDDNASPKHASILPASLLSVLRVIGVQDPDEISAMESLHDAAGPNNNSTTTSISHPGIGMISPENEQSALQALQGALDGMARQLALNMISDANLSAGRRSSVPPQQQEEDKQEEQIPVVLLAGKEVIDDSENQQVAEGTTTTTTTGDRLRRVNLDNAKVLCRSEYAILQAALVEISQRLSKLA